MYSAGTASLQVTASFRGFQREMQRVSKEVATELSKAIQGGLDKGFRSSNPSKQGGEQGQRFGKSFAETAKRHIQAALKTLPDVEINADSSDVDRTIADIRKELKELSGKTIGVDIDDHEAIQRLHELQLRLQEISRTSGSVKVSADTAAAEAELKKFAGEVDKLSGKNATIKAKVDDARAKAEMKILGLEADRLGHKNPTIKVDVDKQRLGRSEGLLANFGGGMMEIFGSLGKVVTTLGGLFGDTAQTAMQAGQGMQQAGQGAASMASQIGGSGGGAGGAVGAVIQFTIQLYKMGAIVVAVEGLAGALTIAIGALETAIAALPGVIFGAASAIGVLILAFKNVGQAIQDGWNGKSKQFKKDLKGLPPQVQTFARAIVSLKKPFKQLENIVSKNFFGPFAKLIKPLSKTLIPALSKGLGFIAKSLGKGIAAFLKWAESAPIVMLITQLLGGMSGVFDHLLQALIPFADGFLNLVDASLPFLISMATWLSKVATAFDNWTKDPKNMKILQDAFNNLMVLLPGIVKLAEKLAPLFLQIFADPKTRKAMNDMFATLTEFVEVVGPRLPGLVQVFDDLMSALQVAMPAIGSALGFLTGATHQLLTAWSIVTVYIQIAVGGLINWFNSTVKPFFTKTIPSWFWTAWRGIQTGWHWVHDNVFAPIHDFFTKKLPEAAHTVSSSVKRWWGDLVGGVKDLWHDLQDNALTPIHDFFTKKIPAAAGLLAGKVKALWGGIVGRLKDLWHDLQNNVLFPIRDFFTKKIPSWAGTLAGKVKSLWGGIVGRVKALWHDFVVHVIDPIKSFFTQKIPSWTGTLAGKVKSLWGSIVGRVKALWHDFVVHVVDPIKSFFTQKIPSWTGTLSGKVKSLWGGMVGRVKNIWHDFVVHVVDPIKSFFTKKIPQWSGTLVGAVKKNFGSLAGSVKKIWNDIKNYVKGPIKGILGMLHDMFHTVEVVGKKFNIKPVISAATSAAATMTTWRNKVNGWRTGGPISGPGSGTSDSIPAWVSNGEHVWTAKEVQAVGGQQNMLSLRKAALRGDIRPAYAKGGPVSHRGAPAFAGGGGVNYVPNIITQIARKFQSGVRMTSGYRSNQTEGHADYHNAGLAADLVSGNMDALAAAFYKVPSYLLEEIHTRAHSNTGWYVKNGKRVSNTFYGANVPLHRDHVHIAMSKASAESLLSKLTGKKGASLLDEIKAFAGSLAGGPVSTFDWATDFYDKYFKQYVDKIAAFGKDGANGVTGDLVSGVGKKVMDGTMDWVKGKFESLLTDFGGDGSPYAKGIPTHGQLADWIKKAMKLTGVYGKAGWYEKLYSIAMRESRGNPRAINNYDINAKNGIPSKGVMQIIPPQYKKHHQPGTSWNMYDPISNIAAAINYIKDVWKTPFNTPANYYASGTRSARPGWSWVGENGPELVRFNGGEQVLPAGKSLSSSNHYAVNDSASRSAAAQAVAGVLPSSGGDFNLHAYYTNMGPAQFKAAWQRYQVQQQLNTP